MGQHHQTLQPISQMRIHQLSGSLGSVRYVRAAFVHTVTCCCCICCISYVAICDSLPRSRSQLSLNCCSYSCCASCCLSASLLAARLRARAVSSALRCSGVVRLSRSSCCNACSSAASLSASWAWRLSRSACLLSLSASKRTLMFTALIFWSVLSCQFAAAFSLCCSCTTGSQSVAGVRLQNNCAVEKPFLSLLTCTPCCLSYSLSSYSRILSTRASGAGFLCMARSHRTGCGTAAESQAVRERLTTRNMPADRANLYSGVQALPKPYAVCINRTLD